MDSGTARLGLPATAAREALARLRREKTQLDAEGEIVKAAAVFFAFAEENA